MILSIKSDIKTAVIYRGMYYRTRPRSTACNFFDLIDNNKKYFLSGLGKYDLFYETTPHTQKNDEMLKEQFEAKKYNFRSDNKNCMDCILNSLEMCDFSNYDFIINLRFGLKFNKPLAMFNMDYTKFNYLWKEPKHFNAKNITRVSDHIFAFPTKFMDHFKIENIDIDDPSIKTRHGNNIKPQARAHCILHYLNIDLEDTNAMVDGYHWSGGHPDDEDGMSYIQILRDQRI